jgi:predicted metal-dependent phosphoesterase TrpH
MAKADLHLHTTYSDGSLSPDQLVAKASELKLAAISITDHDTLRGAVKAAAAAKEAGIALIPGVEFSVLDGEREVHLLVYGLDPSREEVRLLEASQKRVRTDRAQKILLRLRTRGIEIDMDELLAEAGQGNLGRPHIARVMVRRRLATSMNDAFARHLDNEVLKGIPIGYPGIAELIAKVRTLGGVVSLAHPGRIHSESQIKAYIDAGIDAIECIHPSHPYDIQKKITAIADRYHLLKTGGSDFHGSNGDYSPYFGIVTLAMESVSVLTAEIVRRGGLPILNPTTDLIP